MTINAENARAIALDLAIAQAGSEFVVYGRNTNDNNPTYGSKYTGMPLATGYALPHRPSTGRPLSFHAYTNTAQGSEDLAEYEAWATEDIADCWRTIRHSCLQLQNDNQAAAMIVFALHTSTQSVTKFLRPELRKYINDELPATPHTGLQPTLATMMLNFATRFSFPYDESETTYIHRIQEVLLFFGRGIETYDDIANGVFVYNNAVWS